MFDLYVSQVVLDEILAGDRDAAERRAVLVAGIPVLDIVPEVADLAAALIRGVPLPITAGADAAHIAAAAYHQIDFLMTWNSTHIANAELRPRVERVCRESGHLHRFSARQMNSWEEAMPEAEEHEAWRDPIVADIRRVRGELFAAAGHDIHEFCRRLREKQRASGHRVVTRPASAKSGTSGEAA